MHSLSTLVVFSKVEGVILTNAVSRNWQEFCTHGWHGTTRNMDLPFFFSSGKEFQSNYYRYVQELWKMKNKKTVHCSITLQNNIAINS